MTPLRKRVFFSLVLMYTALCQPILAADGPFDRKVVGEISSILAVRDQKVSKVKIISTISLGSSEKFILFQLSKGNQTKLGTGSIKLKNSSWYVASMSYGDLSHNRAFTAGAGRFTDPDDLPFFYGKINDPNVSRICVKVRNTITDMTITEVDGARYFFGIVNQPYAYGGGLTKLTALDSNRRYVDSFDL